MEEWTPETTTSAFSDMRRMAKHDTFRENLDKAEKGHLADHPLTSVLVDIRKFRESIRIGQHDKIEEKVTRLKNILGKEIFVRRKYRDIATGSVTSNLEDLLRPNQVTLLQGAAGAGAGTGRGSG